MLQDVDVNWVAVIVAAVVPMALGAAWYAQALFGRQWMRAAGRTQEDVTAARRGYLVAALAALAMSYVLARLVDYAGATSVGDGLALGVLVWVGFVLTTAAVNGVFAARPLALFAIDGGYHGVSILVMSVILAVWD